LRTIERAELEVEVTFKVVSVAIEMEMAEERLGLPKGAGVWGHQRWMERQRSMCI
jgi:hypothetical protein